MLHPENILLWNEPAVILKTLYGPFMWITSDFENIKVSSAMREYIKKRTETEQEIQFKIDKTILEFFKYVKILMRALRFC